MLNIQDNQKQFNRELIIEASRTEKQYWKDLWNYRELFYFLAWRDILVRYKQTATGMAWAVLRPFLTMLVLKIIFGKLANELNVSANSEREKLNQLTKTKPLSSKKSGRQLFYKANQNHPLFPELKSMVSKVIGIDQVIDGIVTRRGDLEKAYLIDDYAEGKDTGIIDLFIVGDIDEYHLNDLSRKIERYIERKIRSLVLSRDEFKEFEPSQKKCPHLLIWKGKKDLL